MLLLPPLTTVSRLAGQPGTRRLQGAPFRVDEYGRYRGVPAAVTGTTFRRIQVPLDRDALGTFSVSPSELASDYVNTPPPRRLRTGIQALVARIVSTRRD